MMRRFDCRKIIIGMLFLFGIWNLGTGKMTALAAQPEEQAHEDLTLEIQFQHEGTAMEGVRFDIYRVASVDADGEYVITDPFDSYPVWNDMPDNGNGFGLAETLEGYVLRDKISPYDTSYTDSEGYVLFPNEREYLERGMYLVLGEEKMIGEVKYKPSPMMIAVPGENPKSRQRETHVIAYVKNEVSPASYEPEFISMKVVKIWEDQSHEEKRPKEVVIDLLCDGEVVETVSLNEKNSWQHEWKELDRNRKWNVVERELDGYLVEITTEQNLVIVTNTYYEEPEEPETEESESDESKPEESEPDESEPDESEVEESEPDESETDPSEEEFLPKTGQDWWTVLILAAGGLFLCCVGMVRREQE